MDRTILTNFVFNTLNELLVILTPLIVTPYLSRTLGADGVGVFSYTQSIVTYFVLVALLGTLTYGKRTISVSRENPIELNRNFKEIMLFRLITGAAVIIAYFAFIFLSKKHRLEYLYFNIYIIGNILDINWYFIGLEEFKITVIRNSIIKLSSIFFVFLFVKKPEDVAIYVIVFSLSTLLGNLSLWAILPKYLPKVTDVHIDPLRIAKPVLILFIPTIAASIYTVLDKSMLGWIVGSDYQNGCYEQAEKIVRVAITIITSISTVIASRIAYDYSSGNRDKMTSNIYSTAQFIWMLAVPILFGIIAVADLFIPLFLGAGFDDAIDLMRIFSLLVFSVSFSHLIGLSFLIQINRERIYTKAVCISAITNVIMNLILIYLFQARGAAMASVLSELFGISYMMIYCRNNKLLSIKQVLFSSKKYWIAGIIMFMSIVLFRIIGRGLANIYSLALSVIIAIAVYFGALVLLKDEMVFGLIRSIRK